MSQNEALENYQAIQELNKQLQVFQQQMELLEHQVGELNQVKEGLESIGNASGEEEIMIPLGGGVFFKGKMTEKGKVIMNVGSGVVVEKNVEGASKILNEQITQMTSIRENLTKEIEDVSMQMQKLQMAMQPK